MRLDFFLVFFLTFSCYIMLVAILYMRIEKLFKLRMLVLMRLQINHFRRIQNRVEAAKYITFFQKLYLRRSMKILLFDYYYFVKEENESDPLGPILRETYRKVMTRKLKRFLKMEPYQQFVLLQVIEKLNYIEGKMQTYLVKALGVRNHFIRFKILEVIISFKRKGYFLEGLSYLSSNHLLFDRQMMLDFLDDAVHQIPDLTIHDLIRNFDLYDEELKKVIWTTAIDHFQNDLLAELDEIFENEQNSYIRAFFYCYPAFEIQKRHPHQFEQDFHSSIDPLRKAVIEYGSTHCYDQIKDDVIALVPDEKDIDVALTAVKLLQQHHDLAQVDLTPTSAEFLPEMIDFYLEGEQAS